MNPHRGSDFNEFMIEENLMTQEPQAYRSEYEQAFQRGREHGAYRIAELERELAVERALADRLAQEYLNMAYDVSVGTLTPGPVHEWLMNPTDAIAAWKEARRGTA